MFLHDAWYIAAEPAELLQAPLARTILGKAVVLFRTESGEIAALEDRCPHRLVPLSLGKIVGNSIRCAYHGAEFSASGECVRIPGQRVVPRAVKVRSFPVVQRHGYCWIWMGNPAESSDYSTMPDGYEPSDAPGWKGVYGHFQSMKVDYQLLNDNVIDITHAEFVHPESFGGQEVEFFRNAHRGVDYIERGLSYNLEERSLHFRLTAHDMGDDGAPLWRHMVAQSFGLPGYSGKVHFTIDVDWWAPCYCKFLLSARPTDRADLPMARICNLHAAVPETERTTHYFYRSVRNYGDDASIPALKELTDFIFGQDKPVLESQQRLVGNNDLFDLSPVSFAGDRLPVEARRILKRIIDAQGREGLKPVTGRI
jgi:phenylpropionate dioxygenase-like ring-hydroxylating dioxygenase large terminal subunit